MRLAGPEKACLEAGTMVNLVTIAIDDLFAYDQFRDSFGVTIDTPNLDRLMGQSVNFENAYASVAICAPSRAATMSGKTAFETGVHDNFTPLFDVVDPADTWPSMIRDNGYFATSAGKVFHSKGDNPAIQEIYSERITVTKSTLTGEREFTDGGKKWAYLGDDADLNDHDVATFGIDFLDRAPADQEFLLTLGFDHPHTAYFAPSRYFDQYPIDEIKVPEAWLQGDLSDAPAFAQQFASQPRGGEPFSDLDQWKATVQGYLTSITHMDAQLGRFLDALEASEHAADTAVLVYSDHGYQLGAKDHPVKFTLWEEAAKAPLLLYHPDLEGGKTVTTAVSLMDIMPTVLDITGTDIPDGLTGQSLLSFVTGDGEGYTPKPALTSMYGSFAIRSGDYRYIRYQDGGEELYDLTIDPSQITNLANDPGQAELVAQLRSELLTTARDQGALIDTEVAVLLGTDGADQGVASAANQEIALGSGDDAYFIYENGTRIVETADGGFDTVYYIGSETFVLPENVERVFATLPDNRLDEVRIQGNDQDNILHTGFVRGIFHGGGGDDQLLGGGWVSHEFEGGTGNDVLVGAKLVDLLYGGDGNDRIDGGNDNDLVDGGDGDDYLIGANGNDTVLGGAGSDLMSGESGNDRLLGGADADQIYGGNGADSISGGDGDDLLVSTGGDDLLIGGSGSDRIQISTSDGNRIVDQIGSTGADSIEVLGTARTDVIINRFGDALQILDGDARSIWIDGAIDNFDDQIVFANGTFGLEEIWNGATALTDLASGFGDQTVTASSQSDYFNGHVGNDIYNGKSGDDEVYGGQGDDDLNGGNDNDLLFGGIGDDTLQGGNQNDILDAGPGDDLAIGGAGADAYFYRLGDGRLIIDDKGFGLGDSLIIEDVGADAIVSSVDGNDLVLRFGDGGEIIIKSQQIDRGRIEEIEAGGQAIPVATVAPPLPTQTGPIIGTDQADKLIGTPGDDQITDGAGKDNLTGAAGADAFILVQDGVADSIKDFEAGLDTIDLSAWGASALTDLAITESANGKVTIRAGAEVLSVTNATRDLAKADLTAESFVFAEAVSEIFGTAGNDKLYGGGGDETLTDGAGKDNLYGRAGADLFVFVADGVADSVRDYEVGIDRIDLSGWNAGAFQNLRVIDSGTGRLAVRHGDEILSISDTARSLTAQDLTEDAFIF